MNAHEIIKQWLDVHGLPLSPMSEDMVDGYPRQTWRSSEGQTAVESITISSMAHGAPLGAVETGERFGGAGAYLIEAGISSSFHIAKFFGLTGKVHKAREISVTRRPTKLAAIKGGSSRQQENTDREIEKAISASISMQLSPVLLRRLV